MKKLMLALCAFCLCATANARPPFPAFENREHPFAQAAYDCISQAGTMAQSPVSTCGSEPATLGPTIGAVLDADDTLIYILHDLPGSQLGTIIATNADPQFSFGAPMQYGTTYWVSAVVGNVKPDGVDLADSCLSVAPGTPLIFYPTHLTALQSTSCNPQQVGVFTDYLTSQYGCDSVVVRTVSFLQNDTTFLDLKTCSLLSVGTQTQVFNDQNGCDSVVVTNITLYSLPATLSFDQLTDYNGHGVSCAGAMDGAVLVTVTDGGTPPFTFLWNDGTQSATNTQLGAGFHQVTVTDANGCEKVGGILLSAASVTISLDQLTDYNGYDVSCADATDGAILVTVTDGGTPPFTFLWNNGTQSATNEQLGEGFYQVTVTDAKGCEKVGGISLSAPSSIGVDPIVKDIDCHGNPGYIVANGVGGAAPYLYSFNGGQWMNDDFFEVSEPGLYTVGILDANACETAFTFPIENASDFVIDLVADQEIIFWGESTTVDVITNIPNSSISSIVWSPTTGISCIDCLNQTLSPTVTTTYSVVVTTFNGCTASDEIVIDVRLRNIDSEEEDGIYIPTAFSPNEDGINDQLVVYGSKDIKLVEVFEIYSRKGDWVYAYYNFTPNESVYGWTGIGKDDKRMDPGVFAWRAVVSYKDGRRKELNGTSAIVY